MALTLLASNNASSVLAAGISAAATALTVNTGAGTLFPSPVSGTSYFKLSLLDAATGTITEIMHVTAVSGDTFTVLRGQEGTTARLWSANDIVANMLTAGSLLSMLQISNNLSEIAAAGAAAQSAARTSLGLLSAALRAVGTGTNQIPDMASFNSGSANAFRLPTGHFVQYDSGVSNLGGVSKTYPVPFPTSCEALIGIIYSPTPVRAFVSSNISGRTTAFLTVVDPSGNGISGITVGYIAIGY